MLKALNFQVRVNNFNQFRLQNTNFVLGIPYVILVKEFSIKTINLKRVKSVNKKEKKEYLKKVLNFDSG